ncbi:hypothetical protein CK203_042912 [Vitis vinifera]|uniref:Retrotransposon gag domain-containing protein n=1 Tax=Vitis vinifera TaxID=29760 RepID=A0A438HUF4_VITVI|nr:hypothetical protein CK203_042912 [Vitis vinifera]
MDSQIVTVDQFAEAMASIQEAITSLGRRIDGQQAQALTWEDFDGVPVPSLPAKFRMLKIERYTGIGCPCIHLRLYTTIMRAHGLDGAQMIMIFPMSLGGTAQCWFASLDVLRRRTWDDLAQEFLRQPLERDQIQMVLRSLQPRIARHVVGVPFADFGSLVLALYDVRGRYLERIVDRFFP